VRESRRLPVWLWPLGVAALGLALTAWLWAHERQHQQRNLRDNFDAGLRRAATRIEQRMASYEQVLRGTRGLFDAAGTVSRNGFEAYVDTLLGGPDFAGLRAIAWAPRVAIGRPGAPLAARGSGPASEDVASTVAPSDAVAPVTYIAPATGRWLETLGADALANPALRGAMLKAADSGGAAISQAIRPAAARDPLFWLFMPVYGGGRTPDGVNARRARLVGWVFAAFSADDLMASQYGEAIAGLEQRLYDGVAVGEKTRLYSSEAWAEPDQPARFEAQEYIALGERTWTLVVRNGPRFGSLHGSDSAPIIAAAGIGLSVLLALLSWLLLTQRDRAHAAARSMTGQLRLGAERYRRIVETADEGIWTVDAEGRTTFVNPKMERLLGCSAAEMAGRPWPDFVHEGDGPLAGPTAHGSAEGATVREMRFRRRDDSTLWTRVAMSPIVDQTGSRAGVLAMVTDVSEQRLAEQRRVQLESQLRQSQKMEAIGTLAGGIAHGFNNILAAILGNVELLRQDLGPGHATLERLAQIGLAGERARSLVQQIVAFARRQPPERVAQPLAPLVHESVRLLRSTLPALVELELQIGDEPLPVSADATQLQQVLLNLCTNAWHAMAEGSGRIVIALHGAQIDVAEAERIGGIESGRHARLSVSDDGCGIDQATRARIFEPFFTTKPVGQGTGLGLAVVHGIVAAHGGAIAVDSTPGRGSTFEIYLPLVALPASAPVAPRTDVAARAVQGQHVLYVDDDPVMGVMVEALLLRAGFRVSCLADAQQALDLAKSDRSIEVVVSDYNMPEVSGLTVAQEVARARPRLPVVITSGYVTEALRAEAARYGVRHVLQKEYTLERLIGLLHQVLAERDVVIAGEVHAAQ
jgi:PAS domain S-box-containing protein